MCVYLIFVSVKATRVRLQKKEGEDNSEYINANFIKVIFFFELYSLMFMGTLPCFCTIYIKKGTNL